MLINNLLWILIGILIGIVGFKIEKHKKNGYFTNILFGLFGAYIGGFISHFLINPDMISEVDNFSVLFAIVMAFVFVKLEDYVFPF